MSSMPARLIVPLFIAFASIAVMVAAPPTSKKRILFFTKSSGYEHSVISWKNGRPSHAEKVLKELGARHGWDFEFSKDGSKFSNDYLSQFDAIFFYTTGNLLEQGTDGQAPMTAAGKQAVIDFVHSGGGFVGTHSASDTFHTNNESKKGPDRFRNFGDKADPYVRLLGAEFIRHGAQQVATQKVIDAKFPGFEKLGAEFGFQEEWYSLKDFTPDIHVLTVMDAPKMTGKEYERPPFPTTWARMEGSGRVWYTAMGHREDVWTNPIFQDILVGGIRWALGEARAAVPPNIQQAAPGAYANPAYFESPRPKPAAATR